MALQLHRPLKKRPYGSKRRAVTTVTMVGVVLVLALWLLVRDRPNVDHSLLRAGQATSVPQTAQLHTESHQTLPKVAARPIATVPDPRPANGSVHVVSGELGSVDVDIGARADLQYAPADLPDAISVDPARLRPQFAAGWLSDGSGLGDLLVSQHARGNGSGPTLELSMAFGPGETAAAVRTALSAAAFAEAGRERVQLHVVGPDAGIALLREALAAVPVAEGSLYPGGLLNATFYPLSACATHARIVQKLGSASGAETSMARHCKFVMHELVSTTTERLVHVDAGVQVTSHAFGRCWAHAQAPTRYQLFSLGLSGAFRCLQAPEQCGPAPMSGVCVTESAETADAQCPTASVGTNVSQPAPILQASLEAASRGLSVRDLGAMELSTSVVLLFPQRMRAAQFTARYNEASLRLARLAGAAGVSVVFNDALLINNYVRLYPLTNRVLPCECNHQLAWLRPDLVCPNRELLLTVPDNMPRPTLATALVERGRAFLKQWAVSSAGSDTTALPFGPLYAALLRTRRTQLVAEPNGECQNPLLPCPSASFWTGTVQLDDVVPDEKQVVPSDSAAALAAGAAAQNASAAPPPAPLSADSPDVAQQPPSEVPLVQFNASSAGLPKITVIIQSYNADGFRPMWLIASLRAYASKEFAALVDRVILVWNNPSIPPPNVPESVTVLAMKRNSLSNRWIETIPYVSTDAVLNLDDDMFVALDGVRCMLSTWLQDPDRFVGPYARHTNNGSAYRMDELFAGGLYDVVLPRTALLHRKYLETYARALPDGVLAYVDDQEAHCDDIAMTLAVTNLTNKPPLRVLLPPRTVIDYFDCAAGDRKNTGGLALQRSRSQLRQGCVAYLHRAFGGRGFIASKEIRTCRVTPGNSTAVMPGPTLSGAIQPRRFLEMKRDVKCSEFQLDAASQD